MLPHEVLAELEKLAARIGVVVRHEAFDLTVLSGKGGLCWLRGRPVVLLDGGLPVLDKVGVLAEALSAFDLEALYVPPVVRRRVQRSRGLPSPSRPGLRRAMPSPRLPR